jgi:hypothetical protein
MKKILNFKILIILIVGAALLFYWQFPRKKTIAPTTTSKAQTTSDQVTAQKDFSDGSERVPGNALRENQGSALIEDTAGSDDADNSQDNSPYISSTGEIELYSPRQNETIENGSIINGKSKLENIHYRIIDDVSGVIATGKLSVINGIFSGKISYKTTASNGRIDVFGVYEDLSEFSVIEISLRFE